MVLNNFQDFKIATIALLIFLFFSSYFNCFSQTNEIELSGHVYRSDSLIAIPFALVVDKKTKMGTVSDQNGFFEIDAYHGDTLVISAIGFVSKNYIVPNSNTKKVYSKILLEARTYELEEVGIYAYKNYDEFKEDFIELRLPAEKKAYIPSPAFIYNGNTQPNYTISGPFTALYNTFSKRGKEAKKAAELRKQHSQEQLAAVRYNKDFVASVLNIKDKELDDFMSYCNLSPEYVLSSNDYDLAIAVKECYKSFKNQKEN